MLTPGAYEDRQNLQLRLIGLRIGVVVVALAWLSVQANGGCS